MAFTTCCVNGDDIAVVEIDLLENANVKLLKTVRANIAFRHSDQTMERTRQFLKREVM